MKLPTLIVAVLIAGAASGQSSSPRTERVTNLLAQLRWKDEEGWKRYSASRDDVTQAVLAEVDGFITETVSASSAPADVKTSLDRLFGYTQGMTFNNVAWSSELPSGRFLIVGVEIWRGGDAIAEDAMSFRSYRQTGDHLVFVTATDSLHSSDVGNDSLDSLHVQQLERPPLAGECWFIAWAMVPPRSPYTVAMRLYAFNGETFRIVWTPSDVVNRSIDAAVEAEQTGFTVNSLFSVDGNPLRAAEIKHERFVLTPDGPVTAAEWRTPIQ